MDPGTGKIKEFLTRTAAEKEGYTVHLKCKPKPNCRRCYGRGHIGKNDRGFYVPCLCTQKKEKNMSDQPQGELEVPRYQCHKIVSALKIKEVQGPTEAGAETVGSRFLVIEDQGFFPIRVDQEYVRKHNPQAGGYYIIYRDGYKSFSPAEAFEEGYTRI